MGNEWHDGTPNSGGKRRGWLGVLTIIAIAAIIAGILISH